ncbi:hypothetical protein ACNKHQ_08095 [Shigella flexneri]
MAARQEIWLFRRKIEPLLGKVRFSRIGSKLAETHDEGFRWRHEAVIAWQTRRTGKHELTAEEAQEWYRGRETCTPKMPGAG